MSRILARISPSPVSYKKNILQHKMKMSDTKLKSIGPKFSEVSKSFSYLLEMVCQVLDLLIAGSPLHRENSEKVPKLISVRENPGKFL